MNRSDFNRTLAEAMRGTLDYCRQNCWAGYDPYDGLSSGLFARTPFRKSAFCRLVLTQALKRLPINLRPLLLVPKEQNPKGIALFLSAVTKLARLDWVHADEAQRLATRLIELRSKGWDYTCWGYNFDWQTRTYLVPKFTPNIICTTFAANALLDAYDAYGDDSYLEHAISAGQFVSKGLNRTNRDGTFCFSYTPLDKSRIHNANLLGAALLARLFCHTLSAELESDALQAARFSVDAQAPDGSWAYGEGPRQSWIDSFHTGYNLSALVRIRQCLPENPWTDDAIQKGSRFFLHHFFQPNGVVKYFHNKTFPIDVHAIAQAIITLVELRDRDSRALEMAQQVCEWALKNMGTGSGAFIYQRHRVYVNAIPYMRWGQAWMLLAMATLLEAVNTNAPGKPGKDAACRAEVKT